MNVKIEKVKEVFIPNEYKNNQLIDVMNSNKIGFKILIDNEEVEIIEERNEFNSNILKDDLVRITKQVIDGKEYIDIELYGSDTYE